MVSAMTLVAADDADGGDVVIEDLNTGLFASGFGRLGDGRRFSFQVHRARLALEVYRPRSAWPVPLPEDVVATAGRPLAGVDPGDGRSLVAAVRDQIGAVG